MDFLVLISSACKGERGGFGGFLWGGGEGGKGREGKGEGLQ